MKKSNSLDEYMKKRLEEWANWYLRACDSGLGFPRITLLGRVQEEGPNLINGTGARSLPCNQEAEEVEELVKKLAEVIPKHAKVLRICYFNEGNAEAIALQKGIKPNQYYAHLRLAHEWIKGYFAARTKFYF